MRELKICAYVQGAYAKQNYKNECLDTRQFVGLRVVVDCLERAGYQVDYAGIATVHRYDIVLVSLTSDCDWWTYIAERQRWQNSQCKVLIGGAGVLHITPFLPWFYAAMFGRGEDLIVPLVRGIETGDRYLHESIAYTDTFREDDIYRVCQTDKPYRHAVRLAGDKKFQESAIGCNHRCLFCGYTWQRTFVSPHSTYQMDDNGFSDRELAILDMAGSDVNFSHLRNTAMDGFSQRIRYGVNKKISKSLLLEFFGRMLESDAKPHNLKLYNICGFPSETEEDWMEFLNVLREADGDGPRQDKQWAIELHCTPFRPMPATPMACAPASLKNYRGLIGKTLGKGLKGNLIYQGNRLWSVETIGTDSLPTVMLSMLAHRGSREDTENIAKLCATKKFWSASGAVKEATLRKYFDMDRIFGAFTPQTLPSRYLRTYAQIERMWGNTPLERQARGEA